MYRWITYKWRVPVNTFYKEHIISPQFPSSINGEDDEEAKFRIKIYPSGSRRRDYFSLFFVSDSTETSFKSKISATIFNSDERKHYGLGLNHTFCSGSQSFGWQNFIKISDLMDREQGFIINECIEIWCVIGYIPEPRPRLIYQQQQNGEEEISMDCEDSNCYFEYGNYKLKIDGHVIAERSEIIKNELNNNNNSRTYDQMIIKNLPSVSLATFQKIADYFNGSGKLDGYEREALIVADALQMIDLKEFCESKLAKMVVHDNLKKFTALAIKYNATLILEKCSILRDKLQSKCHFVI